MEIFSKRLIKIGWGIGGGLLLLTSLTSLTLTRAAGTLPNGVAAGDTTSTSTVLWVRGTVLGDVLFEYSTDPSLTANVLTDTATVTTLIQPVKVEITGLTPATTYYYRATDAANVSGEGQFRTAAEIGFTGLRFGVSGDWKEELAPYPSISNADERDLDFFVELGDTIGAGSATSLDEFRLKHNEVYSSYFGLNTWADLRASTSMLATIDDNDVRDNFAGGAAPSSNPDFSGYSGTYINETVLYQNALQAFQEYNPLRNEFYGATGDDRTAGKRKLYRLKHYGRDAAVFVLDTRSFRDEQLPALTDPNDTAAGIEFLTNSLSDTTRTLLGTQQLADLKADLQQVQVNGTTWKFVFIPSPIQNLGPYKAEDRFEGYGAERTDLLRFIEQNGIENVVFIAAGMHGTIVNNLAYQKSPPDLPLQVPLEQTPVDAFEVIVGPVAINPPFGPAIIELALDYDLITPFEAAIYYSLPRAAQDDIIRQIMNEIITPLGYDPIGLNGSGLDVTLLQGGYVAANTYNWTEFEIDPTTQALTVTTYGIDYYTEAELNANPTDVITQTPEIVSQFVINPHRETGSIGDYVWDDADNDGEQDGSETGLAGVTVYLDSNGNSDRDPGEAADTTAADGSYNILALAAAPYTVSVDSSTVPTGYTLTSGNDPLAVTLSDSEIYTTADFGYHQPQSGSETEFVFLPIVLKIAN